MKKGGACICCDGHRTDRERQSPLPYPPTPPPLPPLSSHLHTSPGQVGKGSCVLVGGAAETKGAAAKTALPSLLLVLAPGCSQLASQGTLVAASQEKQHMACLCPMLQSPRRNRALQGPSSAHLSSAAAHCSPTPNPYPSLAQIGLPIWAVAAAAR